MRCGRARRLVVTFALAAASAGCGDVVRTGRSPVYLVIDSLAAAQGNHPSQLGGTLSSDVLTMVTTPAPCSESNPCPTVFNDIGQARLRISPKDIGTAPSPNNDVTITRYRVVYRRTDGRNIPGIDVPFGFDGGVTGTVSAGGQLTLGFEIVRVSAKSESPLVQLIGSRNTINAIADVTFFGRDQVGNDVTVTGSISINFGNFGDG
jgi:hypothetical protein